ncbi:ABC transporter permease [Kushneria aurantia]|uniref:Transport permease protein n=1 Tax=Kushneria aurantia TaxID=504092 RepID=A0ABV6FYX2_9GAMM|nr:ABC transporter permease [Kushneria aurantia]
MDNHTLRAAAPSGAMELWRSRDLIQRMVRRDITSRYRGSVLGLAWSMLNPLIMLGVYTFVFTVVFRARWGTGGDAQHAAFAVNLFVGIIVHGVLAEMLNRAPGLVLANQNYVKKVIFPLQVLPLVTLGSALFHAATSLAVLVAAEFLILGYVPFTALLFPLVLAPLLLVTLGAGWLLASLGVFLRDIGQTMGLITTMLLFLSPIFYPASALPPEFRVIMTLNPLTFIIEQSRLVMIEGVLPNWWGLLLYALAAWLFAWLGFTWFQKTRKGFADVL